MKYIDADKLKTEIKGLQCEQGFEDGETERGYQIAIKDILRAISSLQHEQPEVQNGKFVFPKYLYARTKDNKTIDMSYAPQDMTAIEYIRNDFVEQEQSEVDLEEEIDAVWNPRFNLGWDEHSALSMNHAGFASIARHFWDKGYNARRRNNERDNNA